MAKCGYCRSAILFGGVSVGNTRYCNQECAESAWFVEAADRIEPGMVQREVARIHQGSCPSCNGPGPVDVSTAFKVWSVLVLTSWSNSPQLSCRACGRKRQAFGVVFSVVAGWWGFPWGLIMTPVQVGRNLAGMAKGFDPYRPSPQLETLVRLNLGQQLRQQQQRPVAPA